MIPNIDCWMCAACPSGVPQPGFNKPPGVIPESCKSTAGRRGRLRRERYLKVLDVSANSLRVGTELLLQLQEEALEHLIDGGRIATGCRDYMQRIDELLRLGHGPHIDTESGCVHPAIA